MSRHYRIVTDHPDFEPMARTLAASGLPSDAEIIYRGRNTVATAYAGGRRINIKEYKIPHRLNRWIYGWFRGSKAAHAYRHAIRLGTLGIRTAKAYAYVEVRGGAGMMGRSYLISEQLDDYEPVRWLGSSPERDKILPGLGAFLALVHSRGVWMKDLSPGNVLARRLADGSYDFALVDINRMSFGITDREKLIRRAGTTADDEATVKALAHSYAEAAGIDGAMAEALMLEGYYRRLADIYAKRRHRRRLKGLTPGRR